MDASPHSIDVEALLEQRDAVLRLAYRLVQDPHEAEDIAQNAMVTALEEGGRARSGMGPWLRGVTRHLAARLARNETRNRDRERRAARPEAGRSTEELVVQMAEHRRLLAHLEALEEPFRTAILLRYFEGLPPRRIAKVVGCPVATVKSRLHRGLTRLRARMDADHDGERARWALALVPSLAGRAGRHSGTWTATWSTIVGIKKLTLIAGAVLVLALLGVWSVQRGQEDTDEHPAEPSALTAQAAEDEPTLEGPPERAPPPTPPETTPQRPARAMVVVPVRCGGRVVDEHRRPVEGAQVHLVIEGRDSLTTQTDAAGSYSIETTLEMPARLARGLEWREDRALSLWARARDGRCGGLTLRVRPTHPPGWFRLGTIVLRPGPPLRVSARAAGQPVGGATVDVVYRRSERTGTPIRLASRTTSSDGMAEMGPLPEGACSIWVRAKGYGPAVASTKLPAAETVVVDLPPLTQHRVRVVEAGSERPIPGARVLMLIRPPSPGPGWDRFEPQPPIALTDEEGLTLMPLPAEPLTSWVFVISPRHPRRLLIARGNVQIDPSASETRVELLVGRELRWEITDEGGEIPPDGTTVEVLDARTSLDADGYLMPAHGTIEDGHLVLRKAMPGKYVEFAAVAVLPDGRAAYATLPQGQDQGPPVSFGAPRRVRVRVRDRAGRGLEGVRVRVRGQPQQLRYAPTSRGVTDASGTCLLQPFLPLPSRVLISGEFQMLGRLGQDVDLTSGDGDVEFVLPDPQTLRVRVTVNGEPALPADYTLKLGENTIVSQRLAHEDADRGEIVVTLYTDTDLDGLGASLETRGLPVSYGTIRPSEQGASVALPLDSRGALTVHVTPPADGKYELELQRWYSEYQEWYARTPASAARQIDTDTVAYGPMAKGRWRVRDKRSGLTSAAVELDPRRGDTSVALDLASAGFVRGRVSAPPGTDMSQVRILRRPLDPAMSGTPPRVEVIRPKSPAPAKFREPPGALRPAPDGTFELRVDGRHPSTIRAWHPMLGAAEGVEIKDPRTDVVLGLSAGPTAHGTVVSPATPRANPFLAGRAVLYDASGAAVFETFPLREADALRFGGFAAGTYDIWLDGGSLAPCLLQDVTLGAGSADLGEIRFDAGSSIRVEVKFPEGRKAGHLRLRAESLTGPHYLRSTIVAAGRDPVLTGLGRGRFAFLVRDMGAGSRIIYEGEIDLDGAETKTVTVDLH